MPSRKDNPNRNEAFGRLLSGAINSIATYEGKTAPIVEEELGQLLTLSGKTIQRYKAGYLPPEPRTVQILAEAAIRRGFLGREWLQRFLHAARYPIADKLLDLLCPIGPARPRPPRIYHNLPAPTYSQFVMRAQAFAEVVDGLQQRSAIVLIVGLGGNGKTSLAREVAAHCLTDGNDAPRFDAAVWVSDKDHPGTTNLSIVLDEIARTLDYPGFAQFEHEEKRREVEQLLKRQRVLVIVDNFETITDGALLSWLLNLPEPSKTLITTREYQREFRRSSWPVDLRGMTEGEAGDLITERVRVLKIEKLVGDLTQLEPLLTATGGNPKALEMTLGLIKYERRPLQQVVDDLYAARGELFDDLFTRAWALLDEAARRVLLVMTFFPTSASGEALSATADVQGFAFERAVERLTDLALIDVQQTDMASLPRYALHPLVRAFAAARLVEQLDFESLARKRWVGWYVDLASKVGYCWDDLRRLDLLDPEQSTIPAVAYWALNAQMYAETLQLTKGAGYYYSIRGLFPQKLSLELLRAEGACQWGCLSEEVQALAYCVQLLSYQNRPNEEGLDGYLSRLEELSHSYSFSDEEELDFRQAKASYLMAERQFTEAYQLLSGWRPSNEGSTDIRFAEIWGRCLQVNCLRHSGYLAESYQLCQETLYDAKRCNYVRGIAVAQIELATLTLGMGNLQDVEELLTTTMAAVLPNNDMRSLSHLQYLTARLHILRGDLPAARAALAEAIDLFERLGMRRELAEARTALTDLEGRELAEAAG